MSLWKWSRSWFNRHYGEDIYGYIEKRFSPIIKKNIGKESGYILDAACGFRNTFIQDFGLQNTVGMDINPEVKDKNKLHKKFIIGDLHKFDTKVKYKCIISVYTLEHLHSPHLVLDNFSEILQKNGTLIIVAPQRWHYIAIITRILPPNIKNFCWRTLTQHKFQPYPSYYKLCSQRALSKEAVRHGFSIEYFTSIEGPPTWLARMPPIFILASFWMSLINKFTIFENIRGTFLAILRKK